MRIFLLRIPLLIINRYIFLLSEYLPMHADLEKTILFSYQSETGFVFTFHLYFWYLSYNFLNAGTLLFATSAGTQ